MIVNTERREFLEPWAFGDGAKLLEFGMSTPGTVLGLTVLLADGNGRGGGDLHGADEAVAGRWANNRVVVTGDYADKGHKVPARDLKAWQAGTIEIKDTDTWRHYADVKDPTLYQLARVSYENISHAVITELCKDRWVCEAFIEQAVHRGLHELTERDHGDGFAAAMIAAGVVREGQPGLYLPANNARANLAPIKKAIEDARKRRA
jgi:hypothetical protein